MWGRADLSFSLFHHCSLYLPAITATTTECLPLLSPLLFSCSLLRCIAMGASEMHPGAGQSGRTVSGLQQLPGSRLLQVKLICLAGVSSRFVLCRHMWISFARSQLANVSHLVVLRRMITPTSGNQFWFCSRQPSHVALPGLRQLPDATAHYTVRCPCEGNYWKSAMRRPLN